MPLRKRRSHDKRNLLRMQGRMAEYRGGTMTTEEACRMAVEALKALKGEKSDRPVECVR